MSENQKTLRLLLPQWQGGNNPDYAFGAELLAWLAPKSDTSALIEVPVERNFAAPLLLDNGTVGEAVLLKQLAAMKKILDENQPDRVIIFGGDCSIDQAPFDYLNGKYPGKLGILWLDSHPDVSTPMDIERVHAMILGNLLGGGSPVFAEQVQHPISPEKVMFVGVHSMLQYEEEIVKELGIRLAGPKDVETDSQAILDWIAEQGIEYLAVHFDLDILSPDEFRSILPAQPYLEHFDAAIGKMTFAQVIRIFKDISGKVDLVGLGIAEHMPWDAINLRNALSEIEIFKS